MITAYTKRIIEIDQRMQKRCMILFLGVKDDYPEQKSSLPVKKEKDCELTEQHKEYNRNHSKRRIVVERHLQDKKLQDNE